MVEISSHTYICEQPERSGGTSRLQYIELVQENVQINWGRGNSDFMVKNLVLVYFKIPICFRETLHKFGYYTNGVGTTNKC